MAMNVSLTPQLESFVKSKVEAGFYSSSSEVVRGALRLLQEREMRLQHEIQVGLDQANRGELKPVDFAAIKRKGRESTQTPFPHEP